MSLSHLSVPRRGFLFAGGALALTAPFPAIAQRADAPVKAPLDLLMAPQALPDLWIGDPKAPVTIIEYASMTCSHCADFNTKTLPLLKANYIDKGKVRFVLREFPLDPLAAAGAMLARCSGDKREALVELLFQQQANWAFVNDPLEALQNVVKQTGMGKTQFEACLNDQALFDKVSAERDLAGKTFKVNSTPTFFINGDKRPGEITPQALDETLAPYLK